jgi:hypothetical protein
MPKTKRSTRGKNSVLTIDQWFATQDAAVDKTYAKLRKESHAEPESPAAKPAATEEEEDRQCIMRNMINGIDKSEQLRRYLEEDGWDFDELRGKIRAIEELSKIGVEAFERRMLDTENHDIQLVQKIVEGKVVSHIVIDGRSLL